MILTSNQTTPRLLPHPSPRKITCLSSRAASHRCYPIIDAAESHTPVVVPRRHMPRHSYMANIGAPPLGYRRDLPTPRSLLSESMITRWLTKRKMDNAHQPTGLRACLRA
jgi:hypothetical protein